MTVLPHHESGLAPIDQGTDAAVTTADALLPAVVLRWWDLVRWFGGRVHCAASGWRLAHGCVGPRRRVVCPVCTSLVRVQQRRLWAVVKGHRS